MSRLGTTCHETPNLSFSQPHGPSSPPAESSLQNLSTSSCDSQSIWNEIASLNRYCGPPLSATNDWPSSSKATVITVPSRSGAAEPYRATSTIREFGNTVV